MVPRGQRPKCELKRCAEIWEQHPLDALPAVKFLFFVSSSQPGFQKSKAFEVSLCVFVIFT